MFVEGMMVVVKLVSCAARCKVLSLRRHARAHRCRRVFLGSRRPSIVTSLLQHSSPGTSQGHGLSRFYLQQLKHSTRSAVAATQKNPLCPRCSI